MKRISILTAGGDTPALNATIYGAVERANQARVEVFGLIKGFSSLFNPRLPHVHLNPLFQTIPELDATTGGTLLGASRDYLSGDDPRVVDEIAGRLQRLQIDGLICIGGDGTMNGMQPLADHLPVVLAPKTIDNDLGLNHRDEPNEWQRVPSDKPPGYVYQRLPSHTDFDLEQMVNFVTPGYVTAVFVAASGVERVRTTAESHRRIAIVEVMGRHSGYIALGAAYGQPDIILVPEHRFDLDRLVERIRQLYDLQKNVVIVCGEGIVDSHGRELASESTSTDPAGNKILSGAAEALRQLLIEKIGDNYFKDSRRGQSAREAIFTRKIGHTQRGGRPLLFDRFSATQLGGKAVELLLERQNNAVAILQWNRARGFYLDSFPGNGLRDRWGHIHARQLHPTFYDPQRLKLSRIGAEYLLEIFRKAIGPDDVEHIRQTLFAPRKLLEPYHSLNTDIQKRLRYLES
jgi:6-phosphofructokinase 1